MPELPDILAYTRAIAERVTGTQLDRIRIGNPFLLRTAVPAPSDCAGRHVEGVRRIGKRIALELENQYFLIFHLMISGRFHWKPGGVAKLGGKMNLAALDFGGAGTLLLTEASTKKRASLHVVRGEEALGEFNRGGLEVLEVGAAAFELALRREDHTVKRSLTDPRLFSGIGNAYSDEILHRARLSPFKRTKLMSAEEVQSLYEATQEILMEWIDRLDPGVGGPFPEKVTAFRPEMRVHGRFGQPCPVCGTPVQRIQYADNEANYCVNCQTGGRLLADRGLSRLLKSDWPRTLEELEERRQAAP